jgi:hypothetical protein
VPKAALFPVLLAAGCLVSIACGTEYGSGASR